ncbi:MAG: hypothetical protein NXI09_04770 [Bacteroidetes bacterium]|nr:hypothetical protein [Bacteroidota bacterium]
MSKTDFDNIGQSLAEEAEVSAGQMFGKPCLKVSSKAFAAFYKEEMVFKIGFDAVAPLLIKYSGSQKWDPSGKNRAMKDWLQVPADYKEDWPELAKQALAYVSGKS